MKQAGRTRAAAGTSQRPCVDEPLGAEAPLVPLASEPLGVAVESGLELGVVAGEPLDEEPLDDPAFPVTICTVLAVGCVPETS